ncbi:MAG: hypothetical protein JEZ11_00975 [Desulfobacterales bacterium]|nr:hypothetical protein [Desulfobacterales bacterium]
MNRKAPTKSEMMALLRGGKVELRPLSIHFLEGRSEKKDKGKLDALVEVSWLGNKARFAVECRALSTPKAFRDGIGLLKSTPLPKGYFPLLFLPFLTDNQLRELEREGISGLDLCGNSVVVVPGLFAVFRSGGKNLFSSSAPIKNIYRKNSAMVGRVFFYQSVFHTVQEICAAVNRQNPLVASGRKKPMSLSTVSKALKTLEEDLIISRKGAIRLIQPDKLLEKLAESYGMPAVKERVQLKVPGALETIRAMLMAHSSRLGLPIVATGTTSVEKYAVMQRGDLFSVYCPDIESLLAQLPASSQTDRFPNLELIETEDETICFDARQVEDFLWASPVQVYLELMAGDKRDRETAEQVKSLIISEINSVTA